MGPKEHKYPVTTLGSLLWSPNSARKVFLYAAFAFHCIGDMYTDNLADLFLSSVKENNIFLSILSCHRYTCELRYHFELNI